MQPLMGVLLSCRDVPFGNYAKYPCFSRIKFPQAVSLVPVVNSPGKKNRLFMD